MKSATGLGKSILHVFIKNSRNCRITASGVFVGIQRNKYFPGAGSHSSGGLGIRTKRRRVVGNRSRIRAWRICWGRFWLRGNSGLPRRIGDCGGSHFKARLKKININDDPDNKDNQNNNWNLTFFLSHIIFFGVLGIEPRPQTPEVCILPLYYTPA